MCASSKGDGTTHLDSFGERSAKDHEYIQIQHGATIICITEYEKMTAESEDDPLARIHNIILAAPTLRSTFSFDATVYYLSARANCKLNNSNQPSTMHILTYFAPCVDGWGGRVATG